MVVRSVSFSFPVRIRSRLSLKRLSLRSTRCFPNSGCAQYLPHRIKMREWSSSYFIWKMWGIGQEEVGDVGGG